MTVLSSREFVAEEAALGARELIEYCYQQGWTDGLPVVPPIQEFVDEFLAHTDRDPDEVLMVQEHLSRSCNVRQAAINAVMAGCKPEYLPVVLAAMDALDASGVARGGLLQSTTGQAEIIIVNGPLRNSLGFNATNNIFGPGDRPNATVGRALRLIVMNVLGIRPHEFDQSTQGSATKYFCCIAENEEDSPWEPLHVERGFDASQSTVTVQMVRSDIYVEHRSSQVPEEILITIADSMSYGGAVTEVTDTRNDLGAVVVMGPEHAQLLAARGWSKQDCKHFLFEHFGKRKSELRAMGKLPPAFDAEPEDAFIPHGSSEKNVILVVAGANNAGVSTVCPSITTGREIGRNGTQLIRSRN
ncbi:MAG: hypothetical protein JOZ65_27300 [Chloroflexi bacterium]|nr:hypothetical protein [Chloroflexota bacterium]